MGRPISERMRDPKWWRDQGFHALGGAVACGLVAGLLGHLTDLPVALAAFLGEFAVALIAVTWEAVQNWGDAPEVGSQMDSIFDLAAFWLGGCLGLLALLGA